MEKDKTKEGIIKEKIKLLLLGPHALDRADQSRPSQRELEQAQGRQNCSSKEGNSGRSCGGARDVIGEDPIHPNVGMDWQDDGKEHIHGKGKGFGG